MFPRSIFYLLVVFIIDLILKSIRDKKEIQKAKNEKMKEIPVEAGPYIEPKKQPRKEQRSIPIEEKKPIFQDEKIALVESWEVSSPRDYEEISDEIGDEEITKKRRKVLKMEKEDILKGIIYAEILSEPKSLRR